MWMIMKTTESVSSTLFSDKAVPILETHFSTLAAFYENWYIIAFNKTMSTNAGFLTPNPKDDPPTTPVQPLAMTIIFAESR